MFTTHQITENFNAQTVTFTAARLVYRAGWGIVEDVERIRKALKVAILLFALLCSLGRQVAPGAILLVRATLWAIVPALAMFAVLTVPGLPLCLAVFAAFAVGTWAVSK